FGGGPTVKAPLILLGVLLGLGVARPDGSTFTVKSDSMSAVDQHGRLRLEVDKHRTKVSLLQRPGDDLWVELRPRFNSNAVQPTLQLLSDGTGAERRTAGRAEAWWLRPDGF